MQLRLVIGHQPSGEIGRFDADRMRPGFELFGRHPAEAVLDLRHEGIVFKSYAVREIHLGQPGLFPQFPEPSARLFPLLFEA